MLTYALTALAIVALFLYFLGRGTAGRNRPRGSAPGQSHRGPFAAVSLEPAPIACGAARELAGIRYLRNDAPSLPLDACDGRRCGCRLLSHADRRRGARERRLGIGLKSELYLADGNRDRRTARRGRRRSDLAPA